MESSDMWIGRMKRLHHDTMVARNIIHRIIAFLKTNSIPNTPFIKHFPDHIKEIAVSKGFCETEEGHLSGTLKQLKRFENVLIARRESLKQKIEEKGEEIPPEDSSILDFSSGRIPLPVRRTPPQKENKGREPVPQAQEAEEGKEGPGQKAGQIHSGIKAPTPPSAVAKGGKGKDKPKPPQPKPLPAKPGVSPQEENKEKGLAAKKGKDKEKPKEKVPVPQIKEVEKEKENPEQKAGKDSNKVTTSPPSAVAKGRKRKGKQNPSKLKLPARPKLASQEEDKEKLKEKLPALQAQEVEKGKEDPEQKAGQGNEENREKELAALRQTVEQQAKRIKILEEEKARNQRHKEKIGQQQQAEEKTADNQLQDQIIALKKEKTDAEEKNSDQEEKINQLGEQLKKVTISSGQLQKALNRREGVIQEKDKVIAEKQKENDNLKAQLSLLQEALQKAHKKAEEKTEQLSAEKRQSALVEEKYRQVHSTLRQEKKQSEEQNGRIRQQDQELARQNEESVERRERLAQLELRLQQLLAKVTVLTEESRQKDISLARTRVDLAASYERLTDAQQGIAALQSQNIELQAQLQEQQQNRSWEAKENARGGRGKHKGHPPRHHQGRGYSGQPVVQQGHYYPSNMGDILPRSILNELGSEEGQEASLFR